MSKKILFITGGLLILVGLLIWLFIESSKPAPGEKVAYNCDNFMDFSKLENPNTPDKCRMHVPMGAIVNYSTNPPVFGPHDSSWITKGFYNEPRADGNLIHSLEHGYVIISYDCEKKSTSWLIKPAFAQGMTAGSEGSPSASLESMPESFRNGSCDNLKKDLKDIYQKNTHKLIVIPRVGMDSPIILTAWGRIEKLSSVDGGKIKEFIDAFRDAGPEATAEP